MEHAGESQVQYSVGIMIKQKLEVSNFDASQGRRQAGNLAIPNSANLLANACTNEQLLGSERDHLIF